MKLKKKSVVFWTPPVCSSIVGHFEPWLESFHCIALRPQYLYLYFGPVQSIPFSVVFVCSPRLELTHGVNFQSFSSIDLCVILDSSRVEFSVL